MTNDQRMTKSEYQSRERMRRARFGFCGSDFFRHSEFGSYVFSVAAGFQRVCVYRGASARAPHGVFGALAASGCGGGRHVERRKRTYPKVPMGTTESSPRFQPWVASGEWPEPRRGDRKDGTGPMRSFVPNGTRFYVRAITQRQFAGLFSSVPAGRGIATRQPRTMSV